MEENNNRIKILLVDDRAENLFALEVILSNENYLCVKATSGKEALKILNSEQNFAIILMDVQMPNMDGFETVELIRKIENLKHVPIIFLTASMDTVQIFKGYQAGAVDYMIKPISPEILKAKVAVLADLYKKTHELLVQAEQMKALISDVTAQKLLSKYSLSLIEASHDPLFAVSIDGKITDMNNASEKVTGVSRENLIGSDFIEYFTDPDKARDGYQQVFAKSFVADYPLTIKDAELTEVLVNGSVYKDDKGNVLGVVVVARDVTAQKRFENELIEAKSNAECATLKAEESTKLKEAFLANMSHEIRTPMNAIIGFSDILVKRKLGEQEKEYVKIIKSAGEKLLTIINDILDISKIEAGMMTFEENSFSVKDTFKSLNVMLMEKANEKNIELLFSCDKNVPDVLLGDHTRLTQIIINLTSNAIKFTEKGRVYVHAKVRQLMDKIILLEFSIKDTGIGIPKDKLEQIFERFRQAESHTTRKYGGTGLGLSIAKQLVELQGGTLSVESELNMGSVFSFCIPYKITKQTQPKLAISKKNYIMKDMINLNILLVEDNKLNVKLILSLFSENNLKLVVAENGKIGIEKIKETGFDIILMDMEMPVMNGYEATSVIRKEMKSKIPIIAMTAHAMAGERERCLSLGMNEYLSKPIDANMLFEKMYDLTISSNKNGKMRTQKESGFGGFFRNLWNRFF